MKNITNYSKTYNRINNMFLNEFNNGTENTVLSTYSLITLLALLAKAVDAESREKLYKLIAPDMSTDIFDDIIAELQKQLDSKSLSSANAVAVRNDLKDTVKPDFINTLNCLFRGELFSSSDIVNDVNSWVNEHTKGMIKEILSESQKAIAFVLMNALAFTENWEEPYTEDDVYEEIFVNRDRSKVNIPMLHSKESLYVRDSHFKGFIKRYENDKYSFMALLPNLKNENYLKEAVSELDIPALVKNAQYKYDNLLVSIPEFEIDGEYSIKDFLESLGLSTDFSFSRMTTAETGESEIYHKAHIKVNSKGTEAAAVTYGIILTGAFLPEKNIELNFDRPFVYAVIDNETGLPVFSGIVNKIEER